MNWISRCGIGLFFVAIYLPAVAVADEPMGAPNVPILVEGQAAAGDASDNLHQVAHHVIGNHWIAGACPEGGSYGLCDALRFGSGIYNKADCTPGVEMYVDPHEDGGEAVETFLEPENTNNLDHCADTNSRHLGEALYGLQQEMFPGLEGAGSATKDQWFEHPTLALTIFEQLPTGGDEPVKSSLQAACALYQGVVGEVPSMPVWAMTARREFDEAVPFSQVLSAAGGTGICCDTATDGPGCDYETEAIDMCAHIEDRDEDNLRDDIVGERYNCQDPNVDSWQTGAMNPDTGPEIRCHLDQNAHSCNAQTGTDLFGKFSCIRQVPREFLGKIYGFEMCDSYGCEALDASDFEYVGDNEDMIWLNREHCGNIDIFVEHCPMEGEPCDTGKQGRCSVGEKYCEGGQLLCEQKFSPLPETCNGLDDNCDGKVDNVADTFDDVEDDYKGYACYGAPACSCPTGAEPDYVGDDQSSRIEEQQGVCFCTST